MLHLNADHPQIIVPLFAHTLDQLEVQAKAAQASAQADLVELRLDPLRLDDWLGALAGVRTLVQKPLIVTIRTAREGGEVALDDGTYRDAGLALLQQGGVDALDIQWRTDASVVRALRDAAKRAPRRCSASIILTALRTATPWWRPCTGCWTPGRT